MLELEKWGKGKLILLVIMAHWMAASADAFFEACRLARKRERFGGLAQFPDAQTWCKLYDSASSVEATFRFIVREAPNTGALEEMADLRDAAKRLSRMSRAEIKAELAGVSELEWRIGVRKEAQRWQKLYAEHLAGMRLVLQTDGSDEDKARELLRTPEALFLFRVAAPCWIEYGTTPRDLMAKAGAGNMDAIERILRLDKLALQDQRILKHYHEAQTTNNDLRLERFRKALALQPRGRITREKVKCVLAAAVHKLYGDMDALLRQLEKDLRRKNKGVKLAKVRVTAPEVRKLFDAVARDSNAGLRDLDLRRGIRLSIWRSSGIAASSLTSRRVLHRLLNPL